MFGGLFITAPMFGFSSYTSPLADMVYISMLGDIFCILGTTFRRCNSKEYVTSCSRLLPSLIATIFEGLRMELKRVKSDVDMVRVKEGLLKFVQVTGIVVLTS